MYRFRDLDMTIFLSRSRKWTIRYKFRFFSEDSRYYNSLSSLNISRKPIQPSLKNLVKKKLKKRSNKKKKINKVRRNIPITITSFAGNRRHEIGNVCIILFILYIVLNSALTLLILNVICKQTATLVLIGGFFYINLKLQITFHKRLHIK